MDRRKPKKSPATAKKQTEEKSAPLYAANQVLAYKEDGSVCLAVVAEEVATKAKVIIAKKLIPTNKTGRYGQGDDLNLPVKDVVGKVDSSRKGKTFEIAKKSIPSGAPAKGKKAAEPPSPAPEESEEEAPAEPVKTRSRSTPAKPQKSTAAARSPAKAPAKKAEAKSASPKPSAKPKGEKATPQPVKKAPAKVAAKATAGTRKAAAAKKPDYRESSDSEQSDAAPPRKRRAKKDVEEASDFSEGNSEPEKAGKPENAKKRGKKKLVDVQQIEVNEEVASTVNSLDVRCCVSCNDRNVVRASLTGNEKLFKVVLASHKVVSSLFKFHGPELKRTGLFYAFQSGEEALIRSFIREVQEPKMVCSYRPAPGLAYVGTGHVSMETFGVAVRQVNMSRGGREGNNALLYPEYGDGQIATIAAKLVRRAVSPDLLNLLFTVCPETDNWLSNSVGDAVRTGDLPLALHMVQIYNKKGGYGFNFLHEAVLKKAKLPEFKKVSVTKKVLGNACIAPLHCACINPDTSHLQELLPMVDNIGYEDSDKWKAVHYAAVCVSAEPMKVLCDHGANINDLTKDKVTPLMLAAKRDRAEVIEFLLKRGANIDMKSRKGKAALHYAAQYGSLAALKVLLRFLTKKTLDMPGPEKMTPLIVAATKGQVKVVSMLLEAGSGVKKRDKQRRSALLQAVKNGHGDIASLLLARGADPNDPDSSKNAPLHYSCAYGWWQCTDLLLSCQADVNATNDWKLPPLLIALLKGHFGLMKHLLEFPGVDVNCKDEEGRTLLSRSVDMLSRETIEQMEDLLKSRGADPNIPDLKGLTPLHHLARRTKPVFPGAADTPKEEVERWIDQEWALQEEAANLLLTFGANINAESEEKLTPVLLSLQSRNSRMCRFFLQKGAAIQLTTKDGSNILHATAALDADLFPIVSELLQIPELQQHINAVNEQGFTPLLSFCKKFKDEANQAYQTINARLRAEMIEEAKKKAPQEQGNVFLAGLNSSSGAQSGLALSACVSLGKTPIGACAGGLFGGVRTRHRARFAQYQQSPVVQSYLIDELELVRKTDAEFKLLIEAFAKLLSELVQKGADPKAHVDKLLKYRADPQIIRIEYEETRSQEAVLKTQQTYLFGQPQSTRTFFITDFDGSSRWNEYNEDGLKGPLHFLLSYPHCTLIEEVLKLGLDLNMRGFSGETALHEAVKLPTAIKYTTLLLEAGADPNVRNCKGQTPLHHACGTKNPALVLQLLQHKAEAEFLDVDGTFPLKIAVEAKDSNTVRTLLDNGVNPNFCDGKKRTALHHAFNSADVSADASFDLETLLLEAGADINLVDVRNRSPLHYAFVKIGTPDLNTQIDPVETVSSACSGASKPVDPNLQDSWGRTPLHYAAQRGAVTSAIIMVEAGAHVGVHDNAGNTPFGVALANGHSEFATMLLQHNIDINVPVVVQPKIKGEQSQQTYFGQVDLNDYTYNCYGQKRQGAVARSGPLAVGTYSTFRVAVKQNWLGVAYLLLYRKYDYMRAMQDAMSEQKFQLCLTLLAKVTDSGIVRQSNEANQNLFHTLALYGAAADQGVTQALGTKLHLRKVEFAQRDTMGRQPLHIACSSQYPFLVSFLLNLGADVNALDSDSKSPLVHAIEGKRVLTALPTIGVLAKADFNISFQNEDGLAVTPIIHAVMQSADKEVVLFFLKAGADIAAKDGLGRNLLVHAIKKNSIALVEAILGFQGLDMTSTDEIGWTYVHHVVCPLEFGSFENEDILEKLAKAGAALGVADKEGYTPYYYACRQRSGTMRAGLEALGVKEEPTEPPTEAEFSPATEVDFHSDFEEYLKTKAESMEIEDPPLPDSAGDFPAYYEVVDDFDLLMVRVDLAYGPFSAYLFYRMQLLRDRNRDVYVLFTRWGRIGETGAFQRTPFSTRDEGENEFKKVFREKTKNTWGTEFKHVKGKYRLLNIKKKRIEHKQFLQLFDFVKAPPATVRPEVQGTLKQLTDTSVYTSVFNNSQINLSVLNFDNIGKSDLVQAEDLLCEIGSVIQKIHQAKTNEVILDFKEKLYDLSSRFYEIIPLTTFLHTAVVPIQQEHELKAKMDMLESLRNVEIASKIILGALHRQEQMNPYDYCYFSLRMLMDPLDPVSAEFKLLSKYAESGGNTHKVLNIFRIDLAGEAERIRKHESVVNRMLLWHGSAITNLMGIFTQGLRIAPPEAPATGYMFGKGIYFADLFSKSIQYCTQNTTGTQTSMFIMLAEVVLGKMLEKFQGENIEKLPHGYQSVKGLGRGGPDYSQSVFLQNGICVPCGPTIQYPPPTEVGQYYWLQFNEYIVYNVNQVRLRYLFELKI